MIEILVGIDVEALFHGGGHVQRSLWHRRRSSRSFVVFRANGQCGVRHRAPLPRGCRARAQRLGRGRKQAGKLLRKAHRRILQQHAILRALGPGHTGLDCAKIEFERLRVFGFRRAGRVEESLLLVIGLDQRDLFFAAAGEAQVAQRLGVDREDAAGGAVLGRHVADGGAIGQRQLGDARPVELDELAHHAELAQRLRHGQHEIGGGRAFAQLAGELVADHLRNQHGDRLAEHGRLGLDAAHAPAQHAQAVDHGGVRVGADQRVGIGDLLAIDLGREDHARQVLEIHLVADAHARRHGGEVAEGRLAPLQKRIALAVALELEQRVGLVGLRACRTRPPAPSGR